MIRTILFATDLGVQTPYLLEHVNTLALEHGSRVVVLHVIEPPGYMADAMVKTYLPDEHRRELENEGIERIIDEVKARLIDSLEDEYIDGQRGLSEIRDVRVVAGKPAELIIKHAESCGADLLVLGSHGPATSVPYMLGSVTSKILHLSRVPVLMVPLLREPYPYAKVV